MTSKPVLFVVFLYSVVSALESLCSSGFGASPGIDEPGLAAPASPAGGADGSAAGAAGSLDGIPLGDDPIPPEASLLGVPPKPLLGGAPAEPPAGGVSPAGGIDGAPEAKLFTWLSTSFFSSSELIWPAGLGMSPAGGLPIEPPSLDPGAGWLLGVELSSCIDFSLS